MKQRSWLIGVLALAALMLAGLPSHPYTARASPRAAPASPEALPRAALDQGGIGGPVIEVAAEAGRVYILQSAGLSVFDVSNPQQPALLTRMSLPWTPTGLAVSGGFAYTFEQSGTTVAIIDLRTPGRGQIVKTFSFGAPNHRALAAGGGYLYLSSGSYPLAVVDVRDPLKPGLAAAVELPGFDDPIAIQVAGPRAYAISWSGTGGTLYVLDVSKPSAASLKGTLALEQQPSDVAVSGTAAVVTDYQGASLIDASNPARPVRRARLDFEHGASAVTVEGQRAYMLYLDGDTSAANALIVADIPSPAALQRVGRIDVPGHHVRVPVVGGLAYLAADSQAPVGLRVLDVHDPAQPAPRGSARLVGLVRQVRAAGRQVAALTWHSGATLWSLEDSGANGLQPEGAVDLAGAPLALEYNGLFAYAALQVGSPLTPTSTIQAIDLSNPISPTLRGSVDLAGRVTDMQLEGDKLFLTTDQTFQTVDLSQPGQPALRGALSTPDGARALAVAGGRAYVTGGKLLAIDISDLDHPALLGSVEGAFGNMSTDMVVDGAYVFVSAGSALNGLPISQRAIHDTAPQQSGQAGRSDPSFLLFMGYVYAYDVSDPAAPRRVGQTERYNAPIERLVVREKQLLCATSAGLLIVDARSGETGSPARFLGASAGCGPGRYRAAVCCERGRPADDDNPSPAALAAAGAALLVNVIPRPADHLKKAGRFGGAAAPPRNCFHWLRRPCGGAAGKSARVWLKDSDGQSSTTQ